MRRRSVLTHSGMQRCTRYPLAAPIMAMAIPVLPDVGSRIVMPFASAPRCSALVIMQSAGRSFTDPPGLHPSSLQRMRTPGLLLMFTSSTSGVLPIACKRFIALPFVSRKARVTRPTPFTRPMVRSTCPGVLSRGGRSSQGDAPPMIAREPTLEEEYYRQTALREQEALKQLSLH